MAIQISQQPTPFYPSYNNSFIKFTTGLGENDRAVLLLNNTYQFTIFPDSNGNYLFNMREVAKVLINPNEFKDELDATGVSWGFSDTSLYVEIPVEITAYGNDTEETSTVTYSFVKSVKQYGNKELTNPYQLMLPSEDGLNYKMTYFEGYPFEIPFRYLSTTDSITIKNLRTEQVSQVFTPTQDAPYRLFIDKGTSNWNGGGVLEIPDMMSRLDILETGIVKTSIELTKKQNECGKYLKWFNADGSYYYWLFHQWYKQDYTGKEIDRVSTNNFSNIYGNQEGITKSSGKSGGSSIKLKTIVTEAEKNNLVSLITSPFVQLWSEETPYQNGRWINIKVLSNGFTYANKKTRNQISIDIELPEVNTQTL